MRWSSGFLKSSWMTLWSTYCTARSTFTRGTSSCSYCMNAIVPVASWSNVWSIFSEIGSPGSSSPSTRCSRRIWRVRFSPIRRRRLTLDAHEYPHGARQAVAFGLRLGPQQQPSRLALHHTRLELEELAHGRRLLQRDLEPLRQGGDPLVMEQQRHRFPKRRRHNPAVRDARRPLVVLLQEEAAVHALTVALHLELQAEQVGLPAAEAELVV